MGIRMSEIGPVPLVFVHSYSVNEDGIWAGSLSPIPDQITSQKNEQRMEGSIEPRNGKPCFKLSQSGSKQGSFLT